MPSNINWHTIISRYALNVKGLTFKTEWIEYPDIEGFCKERGIPAVNTRPDGSPFYTLPMIHDQSTNKYIVDSYRIAEYLDDQYPDTPTLLPKGTRALQAAFVSTVWAAGGPALNFIMPATHTILNEASQGYFYRNKGILALKLPEDKVDEQWKKFEAGMGVIDGWLQCNAEGQKFIAGDAITFADIALAAWVLWHKKVFNGNNQGRGESKEWERIEGWHGGRWAKLVANFEQYE